MKAVVQRVLSANVTIEGEVVTSIGKGLCVLLGISRDDKPSDAEYIIKKILNSRFFEDDTGKRWNKSVKEMKYEVLCLSQVTLYHKHKGNKLDFHTAMNPDDSKKFFDNFVNQMRDSYDSNLIKNGVFGAYCLINIQNDGPVTIVLESTKDKE